MFRSSTLVMAVVLGAGLASEVGCRRGTLGGDDAGGQGQIGGRGAPITGAGAAAGGVGAAGSGAATGGGVWAGSGAAAGGGAATGGGVGGASGFQCGAQVLAAPSGLDVLLIVTGSASMNHDMTNMMCAGGCGPTSKWAATKTAIDNIVRPTQTNIRWGFTLAPAERAGACAVTARPAVPVAFDSFLDIGIATHYRTSTNGNLGNAGNTPTRAAVETATSHLATLTDSDPKLIVLITDDASNCPPEGVGGDDAALAVQAISTAFQMGFPTHVIGIAPGAEADTALNQMATAGGMERSAAPGYRRVASANELLATLQTVVDESRRCLFAVPPGPSNDGTTSRGNIDVFVGPSPVPRDSTHTNGWDHTDPSSEHIQLYGPACEAVAAGTGESVKVVFRCLLP